jgi:hypothetical protein
MELVRITGCNIETDVTNSSIIDRTREAAIENEYNSHLEVG